MIQHVRARLYLIALLSATVVAGAFFGVQVRRQHDLAAKALSGGGLKSDVPVIVFEGLGPGEVQTRRVALENTSHQPITIANVVAMCGCTKARVQTSIIPPGDRADLIVTMDGGIASNTQVLIESSAGPYTVDILVKPTTVHRFTPPQLDFGRVPTTYDSNTIICGTVMLPEDFSHEIGMLRPSIVGDDRLEVSLVSIDPSSLALRYAAVLKSNAPAGEIDAPFEVRDESGLMLSTSVLGYVAGEYYCQPKVVRMDDRRSGDTSACISVHSSAENGSTPTVTAAKFISEVPKCLNLAIDGTNKVIVNEGDSPERPQKGVWRTSVSLTVKGDDGKVHTLYVPFQFSCVGTSGA